MDAVEIFAQKSAIVRVAPPVRTEPFVAAIGTERIAVAPFRPRVASGPIRRRGYGIVARKGRWTRLRYTAQFIIAMNTMPDP